MYDASGQRVVRRSQTGTGTSNTKYTVYAFGVQDDVYDGSGVSSSDKYYYRLAGRLIGELNGGKTKFLLTDLLGSVVASISNTVSSAAVLGNQVYGPYGDNPYSKGTITTPKGYTGQYNDALTQLDYFNARYYDPAVGVFLSADTVGNSAGANPYAYVNGNPETYNDPTGLMPCAGAGGYCGWPSPSLPMNAVQPSNLPPGGTPPSSGGTTQTLAPYSPFAVKHTVGTTSPSSVDFGANTCATQGVSQVLCSNGYANYAVYLSTGGEIGLPGPWSLCSDCGPGGGPNENGESGGLRDLINALASDTEGEIVGGDAGAGGDLGGLPDGWEKLDYGPDNKAGVSDFIHIDEAGNKLEATLYHDSGELQISWIDSLSQARSHLPSLVDWLGNSVQTVKGYVSDNLETYFSPESRGLTLVNRMFSSVLEGHGFAPGTIESEGSKVWIVIRRW